MKKEIKYVFIFSLINLNKNRIISMTNILMISIIIFKLMSINSELKKNISKLINKNKLSLKYAFIYNSSIIDKLYIK